MPARTQVLALFLILLAAAASPLRADPRPFRFDTDTFAFANETVWNYVNGSVQPEKAGGPRRAYTRHCFVLTRAAVQFWKFARFDPAGKPLPAAELAARIREVAGRPVWEPPLPRAQRVVFPGYAGVRQASAAEPGVFQANIGLGWPVYFRAGNVPIVFPVARTVEARLNAEILRDLRQNEPTIVWLYLFPSLKINHVVVIFAARREGPLVRYTVYDPNYAGGPRTLTFDTTRRTFSYPPTFYFQGGDVTARAIYRGVLR